MMNAIQKKKKYSDLILVQAIRQGLVLIIPILLIGSFSLVLKSLPNASYQELITTWTSGLLYSLFDSVYNVTFGLLSIHMTISIGYSIAVLHGSGGDSACIGCPLVSVAAFVILTGYQNLSIDTLGPKGMFLAILSAFIASEIFCNRLSKHKTFGLESDGADASLINSIRMLDPTLVTLAVFGISNQVLLFTTNGKNAHEILLIVANKLFSFVGDGFFSGLLFVVSSSVLWFLGIHGSDTLEGVSETLLAPNAEINASLIASGLAPTKILTKPTIDVFVLMGGCGSAICLLLALLLFSKRRGNRKLARMAAFPMLFNINEIMIFGLPVIYNPILFVPFIITPIFCYLTTYFAMSVGLVPMISSSIEWTTPIIIGGYLATKSISGSILQIVNLIAGVSIYRPFILKYDQERLETARKDYNSILSILKESEAIKQPVALLQLPGASGTFAKALASDLKDALSKKEMTLYYQPQYRLDGTCFGAEALLRWKHPVLDMIYPPLILQLAHESNILSELEEYIFRRALHDAEQISTYMSEPFKISVNITGISIQSKEFEHVIDRLAAEVPKNISLCIELTEQTALNFNDELYDRLKRLHSIGFMLAIDDFSMGSTSLQYLESNCFDLVKLDGNIVKKSLTNPRNREIIASIVALSHNLGFKVLAEYVSTDEIRDCMADLGCILYQGWLYAPALSLDDLKKQISS